MATGYYPSACETSIGSHDCDPCPSREHGRIRGVGYINEDYYSTIAADPLNSSLWTAGLDLGTLGIINIPEVEGESAEPAEQVRTGFGDVKDFLLSFDWSISYRDPNFLDNCDFYNSMNNTRGVYYFYYRTETQTYITDQPVTVIAKQIIENDINSLVLWKVDVKWSSLNIPCNYTSVPILDRCWINT